MAQNKNASGFPSATLLATATLLARVAGRWNNVAGTFFTQASIAHKTADYTVTADESSTIFTNKGATGNIKFTLPTATVGLQYVFLVRAAFQLQVDPNGSEMIENANTARTAGTAGQYIWADAVGESVEIVCLETGKWAVRRFEGTWTLV